MPVLLTISLFKVLTALKKKIKLVCRIFGCWCQKQLCSVMSFLICLASFDQISCFTLDLRVTFKGRCCYFNTHFKVWPLVLDAFSRIILYTFIPIIKKTTLHFVFECTLCLVRFVAPSVFPHVFFQFQFFF